MTKEHNRKAISVAIDGPSGAGKSTIARVLAKELGFVYVDTGALYRTIGYYALKRGADPAQKTEVEPLLRDLQVELRYIDGAQHVYLNGEDVSDRIRTPEVSLAASAVSAIPEIRRFLFQMQRDMAAAHNVIMDGRDIGTVVLPNADLKVFLTASVEDRASRRYEELLSKEQTVKYEDVLSDMKKRDYDDAHRAIAPLKPAADAVVVDTTGNTLEESVAILKNMVKGLVR